MTLIVYQNDAIYSDRAVATKLSRTGECYRDGVKQYVTHDRMAVMAVSGTLPNTERYELLYKMIVMILKTECMIPIVRKQGKEKSVEEALEIVAGMKDRMGMMFDGQIYFMTTKHTLRIEAKAMATVSGPADFMDIDADAFMAYGSGHDLYDSAVVMGLDIKTAFANISKVLNGVSANYDVTKRSSLKRFLFDYNKI